jgi:transitional endoplasmic reticulum ATPase
MFAQAIATELDAAFFSVKCSDIASKWFGDSEQNVRRLFQEARKHPCSIIFFDEFEALGAKRDSHATVMKRLVPELLAQMQGFEKNENTLLVIAATNRPWDIDSAFLRPGRFNTSIYVPLPDEEARRTIIKKQLDGIPLVENFDFERVVRVTEKFNGSDVTEFCDKLKDYALQRTIESGIESKVTNDDVTFTSERVHSSVQVDDIKKIAQYQAGL